MRLLFDTVHAWFLRGRLGWPSPVSYRALVWICIYYLRQGGYGFAVVSLSVCQHDNSNSRWRILSYESFGDGYGLSTLAISTNISFLLALHNAMRKRVLCCCPVSVRPSVTLVYCIHMAEDIVKLLSRPGGPIILAFDPKRRYPIPRGTPSAGSLNTRRWENLRLSTEIAVYLGNGTR